MKKILLFISFISLLLVVLIISQLFKAPANNESIVEENSDGVLSDTKLQPLSADVSVYQNDSADWSLVTDEVALTDGTQVKTSATGRALVTRGSDIVTAISSNSELTLSLSEDQKSNILKLIAGETWTKITRALEQDEVYEVHTPTMVAAVRGTSFGVGTAPPKVAVTEGTVWATLIDPETGLPDPSTRVTVEAGFVVVLENGQLVVRELLPEDKDEWFFEHNPNAATGADTVIEGMVIETTNPIEELVTEDEVDDTPVLEEAPLPQVRIDTVSPRDFVLETEDRLVIRGVNLNLVERVVIDGVARDFYVTDVGVLVIEKAELPTKAGEYGIILYYRDTSVSKSRAFEIVEPEPEGITITSVVAGVTNSDEDYVEVHGSGFLLVDSLLVNGQSNQFLSISDNLIQIFDFSIEDVRTVELSGAGEEVSYTM